MTNETPGPIEAYFLAWWWASQENVAKARTWDAERREMELDLADYAVVRRHCAEIYDEASGGRISKPMTYPSEVIAIMHDLELERINEAVAEATEEDKAEITRLRAREAALLAALREIAPEDTLPCECCQAQRIASAALDDTEGA